MDESNGSLRMMLNFGLIYNNIQWQIRAGSLHLPPAELTHGVIGNFEDSVYEIRKNLDIMDERVVSV